MVSKQLAEGWESIFSFSLGLWYRCVCKCQYELIFPQNYMLFLSQLAFHSFSGNAKARRIEQNCIVSTSSWFTGQSLDDCYSCQILRRWFPNSGYCLFIVQLVHPGLLYGALFVANLANYLFKHSVWWVFWKCSSNSQRFQEVLM